MGVRATNRPKTPLLGSNIHLCSERHGMIPFGHSYLFPPFTYIFESLPGIANLELICTAWRGPRSLRRLGVGARGRGRILGLVDCSGEVFPNRANGLNTVVVMLPTMAWVRCTCVRPSVRSRIWVCLRACGEVSFVMLVIVPSSMASLDCT